MSTAMSTMLRAMLAVALLGTGIAAVGCDAANSVVGDNCAGGLTDCDGRCVDISHDPSNCGACGNACGGLVCSRGMCVTPGDAVSDDSGSNVASSTGAVVAPDGASPVTPPDAGAPDTSPPDDGGVSGYDDATPPADHDASDAGADVSTPPDAADASVPDPIDASLPQPDAAPIADDAATPVDAAPLPTDDASTDPGDAGDAGDAGDQGWDVTPPEVVPIDAAPQGPPILNNN